MPGNAFLPDSLCVLERGWLSSNNILGFSGETAALIDSGYMTHAAQTVMLLESALAGRRLERLFNTHAHSDHIGGNAAVQQAFGCEVIVPAGSGAKIAGWDEEALLLAPLGQQAARFRPDRLLAAGDEFEFGGLNWRALAVPGHDNDALAFHNAEKRLLISGDALWRNGFGVIFSGLLDPPGDGLAATRATLDLLAGLPLDAVIPGHGAPFVEIDEALADAYRRLASFEANSERLARHALKVILVFAMLERRQLPRRELPEFLAGLAFAQRVNARHLGYSAGELADWLAGDLLRAGALKEEDGVLLA